MAFFIADASASLPWCFEDEATIWTDGLLERLKAGDGIVVPAHWLMEMTNGMLTAVRRKRVSIERVHAFLEAITALPITVEPPPIPIQAQSILSLSEKHSLTVYDAIYLELAIKRGLPLATLDADLRKAASAENVRLL